MTAKTQTEKVIATNREAYHNFFILETYEAGIELLGTEVKSAREGRVNLKDAYAMARDGQLWLLNAHISQYSHGNRQNHDPKRDRRLLMHKREIYRLQSKIQEKGLTLVPTKLYFKGALIKCELAVARGKKLYDKRQTEKTRDWARNKARLLRSK
jgi:SsrA-binding protein